MQHCQMNNYEAFEAASKYQLPLQEYEGFVIVRKMCSQPKSKTRHKVVVITASNTD